MVAIPIGEGVLWLLGALGIITVAASPAGQEATRRTARAASRAVSRLRDATTDDTCEDCPCHRIVVISRSAHPESAQHILDAQRAGQPSVLTIDRAGAVARRAANLRSYPREPGKQPDEYPPAMFSEGGSGASIRNIGASDNMGAGASMGNQLRGAKERCKVSMTVGP